MSTALTTHLKLPIGFEQGEERSLVVPVYRSKDDRYVTLNKNESHDGKVIGTTILPDTDAVRTMLATMNEPQADEPTIVE